MSELSGYELAYPLVGFWNVFRSRCGNFRIFWQFFSHIEDSRCFHRIKLFLAGHDGIDSFFVNTIRILARWVEIQHFVEVV